LNHYLHSATRYLAKYNDQDRAKEYSLFGVSIHNLF
jgi:hypothetical protein